MAAVSTLTQALSKQTLALEREAALLARALAKQNTQLVLAESCTGGMAAAALTRIPGISKHFCGSSVVYQAETKQRWLEISSSLIRDAGSESARMSEALARQVLKKTRHAEVAAAITGHLGPMPSKNVSNHEGEVFLAAVVRGALARKQKSLGQPSKIIQKLSLQDLTGSPKKLSAAERQKLRTLLQLVASQALLRMVRSLLNSKHIA